MAPLPPPQGMSETDYETIEAAVTETVRGRWFLGEFARRNRSGEMRQLLDAMARIEGAVAGGQPALPPSDPSIRLMMQRIKEIATQLETLSSEMRDVGIDPRLAEAVDHQARAVAGLMRGAPRQVPPPKPERIAAPERSAGPSAPQRSEPVAPTSPPELASPAVSPSPAAPPAARMPRAELPPSLARPTLTQPPLAVAPDDPRLAALSALDGLTLAKKLALFS